MAYRPNITQADFTASRLRLFLDAALSAVGVAYKWGGNSLLNGVDCSGLVWTALQHAGWTAPRTAANLSGWTTTISKEQAQPGDLVFWDKAGSTDRVAGADHVGIYLGGNRVLEASSSQNKVVIRTVWGNYRFGRITAPVGARRPQTLGTSGVTLQSAGVTRTAPPPADGVENSTDPYAVAAAATGGGGVGGGYAAPALAANASEAEIVKFIEDNYGPGQVALLKIPELRTALLKAAREGMVGDRFMVEVEKTTWWKSRSEAMRTWDLLELTNPKEAQDRLEKRKATLAGVWESYGVDLNIDAAARDVERLGLNEAQLNQRVAASLLVESGKTGLDEGTVGAVSADKLMAIARMEYLTQVDRQTAERWAVRAVRQNEDVEGAWRQYLTSLSATRFGIDPASGLAPADIMAPVKMAIAESLELDPGSIDLLDPKYKAVLQTEAKDGTFRPMTAHEAEVWARSQESFVTTGVAEDETANLVESLSQTFGKSA